MDDAAQKRQARKLRQLETLRRLRRDDFVKAALQTAQGQEYFHWLLSICRIDRNPFTANALTTSFACGELNVGQQIRAHIEDVAPDRFLEMLVKHKEETENAVGRDTSTDDASSDADSE